MSGEPQELPDRLSYIPPSKRRRWIRNRWRAPLLIAILSVGFVVWLVGGPSSTVRVVLVRVDGTEVEICAQRHTVHDANSDEPVELSAMALFASPIWVEAREPTTRHVVFVAAGQGAAGRSSASGYRTYFDEDGGLGSRREPWSAQLIESSSNDRYQSATTHGRC